ncbi:MAG: phosphopantothenoylcysteine decarboxylase [Verrucomicrobiota bacterium]
MKPLRFLITAGPTREFLDPIRYLTNRSSGKMGYAIAAACRKVSPHVTLVTGPVTLPAPANVKCVPVTTAAEMSREVFRRYTKADVVIMTAAVCDYRPRRVAGQKIKKTGKRLILKLEQTTDILLELGKRKRRQILVGFAAETNDLERHALDKLRRKQLDLIVANGARAFEADTNRVTLFFADCRVERLPEMTKQKVARQLLKRVLGLVAARLTARCNE